MERKTRTAESNNRAGHHQRKVIPYKEYVAHKAAQVKALTTSKPNVDDKEDWDEELLLPPHETLQGAKPVLQSQEDEWKLMINQDPCSISVAGDSGHETMAVTPEDDPVNSNEKLVGAVGGTDTYQFVCYMVLCNKVSLRSLTNRGGEDVMESVQTCV